MPLRARKRRVRVFIAFIFLCIASGIGFGITWISHYERFVINTIEVEGTHEIPPESIREYVSALLDDIKWQYISQKNIFFFDRDAILNGLVRDMPRIKSVKLARSSTYSQTLIVNIEERQPSVLWCKEGGACYQMDDTGFIFEEASSVTVTSYTFDGGVSVDSTASSSVPAHSPQAVLSPIGQTFADGHMSEILSLLEQLRQSRFIAGGVTVDSKTDFLVHLIKRYDLKVSFGQDANTLVRNLKLVLTSEKLVGHESDLDYIDLRFGNRVYYKMKGGGAAEVGK